MKYDAIVIGSGQAGNPLSQKLADYGWKMALIEKAHLGGTCINTGCTPTKTMVASAQVAYYARNASRWGVKTNGVTVDLPAIVARQNRIVESIRAGQQGRVDERPHLRLYRGQGSTTGPRRLAGGGRPPDSERSSKRRAFISRSTPGRRAFKKRTDKSS